MFYYEAVGIFVLVWCIIFGFVWLVLVLLVLKKISEDAFYFK